MDESQDGPGETDGTVHEEVVMSDFDTLDAAEAPDTLGKIAAIKVPWDKKDVAYWFTQLEMQMELYAVKSQWVKRILLANNLPDNVRAEVKELLKIQKKSTDR